VTRTSRNGARRVALLCLDPWRLENTHDHRPFNYAVRRIQAAIVGSPELSHLEVALIESRSLDVDPLVERLEAFDPDVIGASAYVWSFPTLLEVCRRAKRARPGRTVVFGGPSARPEMFSLPQHADGAATVDALVVGEGEACIQEILAAPDLSRETLRRIPGLAVHLGRGWELTPERHHGPPDVFPSPYQLGLMPRGVTGQIESFRGCPLACSYCEWGDTGVTPRTFGYEYLVRELEALRGVDAKGTWLVDPALNLNSRAFRNLQQAEAEVGILKELGHFRCEIYPSHLRDEHLRFLEDTRTHYVGIGLQSLDKEVLRGVHRPFDERRFRRVVAEVAAIVPDTVVEVILGLPGDTPENFRRTLEAVRELPVAVRVFHCLVLPSALLARAPARFELRFDPFTLQMISCLGWSRRALEETCRWLDDIAENESGEVPHGGTWKFPRPGHERAVAGRPPAARGGEEGAPTASGRSYEARGLGASWAAKAMPPEMVDALARRLGEVTDARVDAAWAPTGDPRDELRLELRLRDERLVLVARPLVDGARVYRARNGVAYSYVREAVGPSTAALSALDRAIDRLHPILQGVVCGLMAGYASGRISLPLVPSTPTGTAAVEAAGAGAKAGPR
jgi:radical SAM superfamily enzyme YgiQ (UPF0313 family)